MKTICTYLLTMAAGITLSVKPGIAEDALDEYNRLNGIAYREAVVPDDTGEVTLDTNATLADYRTYAALHNPALEASFLRWKSSLGDIVRSHTLTDPKLSYGYFINSVETRVGPQRQRVELMQMFPWFGTLDLKSEVSLEASKVQWQAFQQKRLTLNTEVETAWYDLYYLNRSIAVLEENMALLSSLEHVIRARYTVGKAEHAALVRVQVELGRTEERLNSLRDYSIPLTAQINRVLNRPASTPVYISDMAPTVPVLPPDEDLVATALNHAPSLLSIEHSRIRESKSAELGKKRFWPDISIGASWTVTGESRMPGVEDSGKDPVMAMISMNLPIFRGSYESAVNQAQLREQAALREHEQHEKDLTANLQTGLFRFRDASRKVEMYRDTLIPKARQSFAVTQKGFENGTAEFTDLIDTQRTLLELELSFEQAVVDHLKAYSRIVLLTGGIYGERPAAETPWNNND